jgi:hypothetical protein
LLRWTSDEWRLALVQINDGPPPRLIVDDPLAEGLAIGVVWIQYHVENMRIVRPSAPAP